MTPEKVHVIHNWADPSFIRPLARCENPFVREQGLSGKLVVLYAGNMGRFHDLETLLEAAVRLEAREEVVFLFIGGGAKKKRLISYASQKHLKNIQFLPYQPADDLPRTITAGDVGVVSLERGTEGLCVPSKLYTYMAGGLAILALTGPESEVADIVERHECGARASQGDVDRVVSLLELWLEDPELLEEHKSRSRQCLVDEFARGHAVRRYADLLSRATER